jgi:hypothetical protein
MTWREKCVVRILLLVALIVNDDASIVREIQNLASHISVNAPKQADEVVRL